jgi:capsular exopolysaccharide synthesis family protein
LNVTDYLRMFRRYWWLVALFTVAGAAIGAGTFVLNTKFVDLTPKYQSTVTLFVATQTGTTTADAYQNNLFSQERAKTYAALATSEQVAARAVDQLKSPIPADELQSKITATADPNTVMLKVSVIDSSQEQAQAYAAAVADQLVGLVGELETSRRGGTPAAAAVVVDDADYPLSPVGLTLPMRIALGAVGGMILGLLTALLFGVFDKKLRGRENVESATGSLVMAALPRDPVRGKAEVVDLDGSSIYAERIRELRTNLRFTVVPNGSGPPRRLAVTSPAARDGRTTTAVDLAAALAESGRSVLLVDGDLRKPTLADGLALPETVRAETSRRGLTTVLLGEDSLVDAVITDVSLGGHKVALLPAGPRAPRPGELWATDRAATVAEQMGKAFDYVVVDTPPLGTCTDGAIVGALTDGAILLARVGSTTTAALRRAVQTLQSAHVTLLGTVVTFERVSRSTARAHRKQRRRSTAGKQVAASRDTDENTGVVTGDSSVRAGAGGWQS